jgi:hypothetical protein
VQSFDPEARGWTKWEKLENYIKGLWMGYQDHRHAFPKVEAFVPRFYFILHFLLHKEQITLLNSSNMKYCCQDMADSDYHYNPKTQRTEDVFNSMIDKKQRPI